MPTPRRKPTQERARRTVERIVDAGAMVLAERGYHAASTNRIAAAAGISPGTLYGYFADKDEIVSAVIERVVDEARIAMCAEAVGAMDESLKTTVEYLKTRKQFGVTIGSFQTLQHRAADMFVFLEQARSMAMLAAMATDFDDKERAKAVAAAKVQIGKSLKFVGQQAIQLHGGIGMTMEAKIGHYFKRLTMIESTFGDTDYHLRRVSEQGSLI